MVWFGCVGLIHALVIVIHIDTLREEKKKETKRQKRKPFVEMTTNGTVNDTGMGGEYMSSTSPQSKCNNNNSNNEIGCISSTAEIFEDAMRHSDGEGEVDVIMGDADASTSENSNRTQSGSDGSNALNAESVGDAIRSSLIEDDAESDWSQYKCREDIVGRYGRISFYDFTGTCPHLHADGIVHLHDYYIYTLQVIVVMAFSDSLFFLIRSL